jgi:DNA-binding transcriptional regulator YdaS (Cro superfamily)
MDESPLQKACDQVGGQTALAKKIGRKQSTIWNWLKKGIPAEQCPAIERATDGKITRYDLRPDVFGEPPEGAKAGRRAA